MQSRRRFLSLASGALAASALGTRRLLGADAASGRKPLKILILGGTRFIGLHLTELALGRGHSVTFFNRGRTGNDRFVQVERIKGDRNGQIDALKGHRFDAVIDDSGYVPRQVRMTAELLVENVPQYIFFSSVSVYSDFWAPRSEKSNVGSLQDTTIEKVDEKTYGPLKALCERAVSKVYGPSCTIVRPGLIVGPEDNTDRFTYWPVRAARGGDFIAPGAPSGKIQYIDARDLAAFIIRGIERKTYGTFNVVTAPGQVTMGALISACVRSATRLAKPAKPPRPVWVSAKFLQAQKVQAWSEMPVWLPPTGESAAFAATSNKLAVSAGLRCRSVSETVNDTLAWHLARPVLERDSLKAGISAARESSVLAAWHRRG